MKLLHVHALLNRKHELTLAGPTKLVLTLLGNLRFGQTWYNRCLVSIARRDMHFLRKFSQFVNFERHGRDRRGPPPPREFDSIGRHESRMPVALIYFAFILEKIMADAFEFC